MLPVLAWGSWDSNKPELMAVGKKELIDMVMEELRVLYLAGDRK